MLKVAVASQNPVKIQAAHLAFTKFFPKEKLEVVGYSVDSGVSAQPMGDEETLLGALNRVEKVFNQYPLYDYWVSIEGGCDDTQDDMYAYAWAVIKDKKILGKGKTGAFAIPYQIAKLIRQGKELGDATDIVFKQSNTKQHEGAVGILTNNLINRTAYYEHALILAYGIFNYPQLYLKETFPV